MSFHKPRYQHSGKVNASSLPPLHELPAQDVQGGTTGEHYHLTQAEHFAVLGLIPKWNAKVEPLMSLTGEGLISLTGDIIMLDRRI
jgi:hypothetical protein